MRLQKFLSAAGVCSRRTGEALIKAGRVRVNGAVVREMGTKVDSSADAVQVDGKPVRMETPKVYIVLNKPVGYVTSCRHPGERIVLDLIDLPERLFPVGRLDKDSTGLLLLTNDGALHNVLSHPSFDHEKEYDVTVGRPISDAALETMASGMVIMGRKTRPAKIRRMGENRFRIILKEGRNRQIRRMVEGVGENVTALKRIRVANIRIGNLPEGKWRHLNDKEVELLKKVTASVAV